jgi:DtxR family Mn-dependent transcriptional regulator
MTPRQSILLTEVRKAGTFIIESVSDRDAETLRLIESCGITPGARLRVRKISPAAAYSVSVGKSTRAFDLSPEVAADVRLIPA